MPSKFLFVQPTVPMIQYAAVGLSLLAAFLIDTSLTDAIAQPVPLEQKLESQIFVPKSSSTILYVDPVSGNDSKADGSQIIPFKTINRALETAPANSIIQLLPGTYSTETGEVFPISLKPHVTIQGNPATKGQDVIIRGGGSFSSPGLSHQNITILGGANQSGLVGVTVTNPNSNGYGIHIESSSPVISNNTFTKSEGGILVSGRSASLIHSNFFYENQRYGVRVHGSSYPTIKGNLFEQSGTAILTHDNTAPLIIGNRITQSQNGVVAQGRSQPQLRDNFIEGNEEYGLLALELAKPDYNSSADENSNSFRNNVKKNIALQPIEANSLTQVGTVKKTSNTSNSSPQPTTIAPLKVTAPPAISTEELPSSQINQKQMSRPTVTIKPAVPPLQKLTPSIANSSLPEIEDQLPQESFPTPAAPVKPSSHPEIDSRLSTNSTKPARVNDSTNQLDISNSTQQQFPEARSVRRLNEITSAAFPVPSKTPSHSEQSTRRPVLVVPVENLNQPPRQFSETLFNVGKSTFSERPSLNIPQKPPAVLPSANTPGNFVVPIVPLRNQTITEKPMDDVIPAPPIKPAAVLPPKIPAPNSVPTVALPLISVSATGKGQKTLPPRPSSATLTRDFAQEWQPSVQGNPVRSPVAQRRSVPIPVPLPTRNTVSLSSNIPETKQTSLNRGNPPKNMGSGNTFAVPASTLLPVPGADIPVGNIGNMPSVYARRGEAQNIRFSRSVETVSNARYRVIVIANNSSQQEQVRTIVPEAFPTTYRGRPAIQVGAFSDLDKATQLTAMLANQGLDANIEPLE